MRIGLFDWTAGGHHARYARCFARALAPHADVVLSVPGQIAAELEDLPVEIDVLPSSRPPVDFSRPLGPQHRELSHAELDLFEQAAVRTRPDHVVHMCADPVIRRLLARPSLGIPTTLLFFRPRAHYPVAYRCRLSAREWLRAWFLEYLLARWVRRPDAHALMTLEPEAARWWRRRRLPAYCVPEPPITASVGEGTARRGGCVLYGAIAPRKGLELLAQAIALAPANLRVLIAGAVEPGYEARFEAEVRRMEAAGAKVEVRTGYLDERSGLEALAEARCAVLPYPRHYGMSRVLVEACSVGTPVIVNDWGMIGRLVRTNGLGRAVDCSDAAALRHAILDLCAEDHSALFAGAHARFVESFSFPIFQEAVLAPFLPQTAPVYGTVCEEVSL